MADQPNIYSNMVIDTNPGTTGAFTFERYRECSKCHLGFKESQVVNFRGKFYGVPCGCSADIGRLIAKGT